MRILVISNLYPPLVRGGYEILCGQVVDHLRQRGHQVLVLTSDHGLAPGQERADEPEVRRLLRLYQPFALPAGVMRGARLRAEAHNRRVAAMVIDQWRPELAFVWSQLRLTLGAARAAQAAGLPVAYTFNDEHLAGYRPAPWKAAPRGLAAALLDRLLGQRLTLRGLDLSQTTCISQLLKNNLLAQGLPIAASRVIYQGIELDQFPPKPKPGELGRPLRLLYVGQLHAYKGVHTLLEAAHQLAAGPEGLALSLTIVGAGDAEYEARLAELAQAGPARVEFAGRVPHQELPLVYRAHHVFVFPSQWAEPFGLTHLEAMASGLPVVSTGHGGQGEFLVHERNSLVFPAGDVGRLRESLARLAGDPALAQRLALAGRQTVSRDFTLARYLDQLEDFLRQAREKRP